jgi:GTP-binding protein Era
MDTTPFRSGFVTIIGEPNVGKSTLLNTIIGTKLAIVSSKPQTTRHRILGVKNLPHAQLVFLDTPGIHQPQTRLDRYMMQAVTEALAAPEVILYLTDVSRKAFPDLDFIRRHRSGRTVPVFWVLNKIDLVQPHELLPLIASYDDKDFFTQVVPISGHRGDNVPELLASIQQHLPEGPRYFPDDMPTDRDERFFIAELIREQVFRRTHEEVPYAVAVEVEAMTERVDRSVEIDACIFVERESQKGIIVGRQGRMIKAIGTRARQAISHMLRVPVHLRVIVRVNKRWKERDAALRALGFGDA